MPIIKVKRRRPKKTVRKNAAAIKKLSREQFRRVQYYTEGLNDNTANITIVKTINPTNWKSIFNANVTSERQDRFYSERVIIRTSLSVTSSGLTTVSPFYYHIFVVSLKRTYAKNTYFRTGKMTTLTNELDYYKTSIGQTVGSAQWQLNPLLFKIHAQRKGMVGDFANEGTVAAPGASALAAAAVTNIRDANKNHVLSIPWKKTLKRGYGEATPGGNPVDWKDMTTDEINNTDQLYFMLFHSAYGSQALSAHTGYTVHGRVPV